MRRLMSAVIISLVMLVISASQAAATTWVDVYNPADVLLNSHNSSYTYTHNLTDNGFNPHEDIITSAAVSINLYDDRSDPWYSKLELAFVDLAGVLSDTWYDFTYDDLDIGVSLSGLLQLNLNGTLTVTVCQVLGDFMFGDSTLTAYGYESNPVPEPCTMALLGAGMGMIGLARYRRRRAA